MSNIINSNFEHYLLVDIYDAIVVDKKTKEIVASNTLTSCNIAQTTSTTTVQGGKGNATIATLSSTKEITIDFEIPTFNLDLLARQNGTDIIKAAGKTMVIQTLTLDAEKKATLKRTPYQEIIPLKAYTEEGQISVEINGKELTYIEGNEGDDVKVVYQVVTKAEDTEVIEINAASFPVDTEMYLTSYIIDTKGNEVANVTYHFPRVKMSADFSSSTASAREANAQSYSFNVIATDGSLGTLEIEKIKDGE